MLKKLSLKNFKGISVLSDLEFKPITILCGTNSSGKSSILKSILLAMQSAESQSNDSPLLFNGKYTKLGAFFDVIHNHDLKKEMLLSYTFNFLDLQEQIRKYKISRMIKDFFNIENFKDKENAVTFSLGFKCLNSEIILSSFSISNDKVKIFLEHCKDNKYKLICNNIFTYEKRKENSGLTLETDVELMYINSINPRIKISAANTSSQDDFANARYIDMTCHYSSVIFQILLEQISYLGPLRKEPVRRYIYEEEISSIGCRGENAAYIYSKVKENKVKSFFYNTKKNTFEMNEYKFSTALNKWLSQMNIIDFDNNQMKEIIRLNVKNSSGVKVDISDVGFGVSQILPILIEGLRMESGQTLLLEQPEIHLHPKLQMQITDFFIAMALNNKNTIIETHSEHLIKRLVRRSLEDDSISELINIYFINENSEFEKIIIDKHKGIINWPKDFFDQAVEEEKEILNLVIKNRKK